MRDIKKKTTVVIGITSGIAAYKIIDLIISIRNKGYRTIVIMTSSAAKMIDPEKFEKVSGGKVYTTLFEKDFDYKNTLKKRQVDHIQVADQADLFVVAPATANTIAKIAHGIADDFLTTAVMATQAPILICPSMNVHMWNNPLLQKNIKTLTHNGYFVLNPENGSLACGYRGVGRLPEIEKIEQEVNSILFFKNKLKGKKIIITAGGTSEYIDRVRMITNKSSGKMGVALADACFEMGARVLLVRSVTSVDSKYPVEKIMFETGKELEKIIKNNIKKFNCIIHNAAVSDFIPQYTLDHKMDSSKSYTLHLETSVKILSQIKKWNPGIQLIGFKAVYRENRNNMFVIGKKKLEESQADYIIVNDIGIKGIGFGSDENEVFILSKKSDPVHISKSSKKSVAREILKAIFE